MIEKVISHWKQFKNTRLYRRLPVEIPVLTRTVHEMQNLWIVNWSPGGVFIRTQQPLPLFTRMVLVFSLGPNGAGHLHLTGQVVRHGKNETGTEGMGVMFTDLTEAGIYILRDFLIKETASYVNASA